MSDAIISVEGLGKCYRLQHRQQGRRYKALRDVLTDAAKGLFSKPAANTDRLPSSEEFWALKDVSFEIKAGEVMGIIGRNGAGKSTLLKILSRITEPTRGRVTLRGRVASLLEVGTGFHPELTGRENIFLNGAILGMTRAEIRKKFDEIVDFAEVEKFLDTPVKRYSSGMYVRLAFAVAAHLEPEILVVDEVLAVGDVGFQKKCLGKMSGVSKSGRTVLFVSHNMQAILFLTQRAVVLEGGEVRKIAPSKEAVDYYEQQAEGRLSGGSVDLSKAPRAGGDGQIRITKVSLRDEGGNLSASFAFGDPIRITLEFESAIDSAEFEIGYGVRTLDGLTVCVSSSSDDGKLYPVKPGKYAAQTTITPNHLVPGHYYLAVGITCNALRDLVLEGIQFEVNESKLVTKSPLMQMAGYVHFDYKFSIERV
jgi:lipopolysaccharide transport system ATP-binding protein